MSFDSYSGALPLTVVHSDRGMVLQRIVGIKHIDEGLVLLMDDDIIVAPETPTRLLTPIVKRTCEVSVPESPRQSTVRYVVLALTGNAFPHWLQSWAYVMGGGYRYYYRSLVDGQAVPTECGQGAIIAVDSHSLKRCNFKRTMVYDSFRYALREDSAFLIEAVNAGLRVSMIGGCVYEHLGVDHTRTPERQYWSGHAEAFNNWYFWFNNILPRYKMVFTRAFCLVFFIHRLIGGGVLAALACCKNRSLNRLRGYVAGTWAIFHARHGQNEK